MSEVLYIHQNFTDCLSDQHIYFDMPNVTTSYERFPGLIWFFGNFNVWQNYPNLRLIQKGCQKFSKVSIGLLFIKTMIPLFLRVPEKI